MVNLFDKFPALIKVRDKLKLDNKKILLPILVCLVIICIDFSSVIKLQFRGIRSSSAKIIKLKQDLGILNKDLLSMQQNDGKQVVVKETKKIISRDQVSSLLQDISDMANKHEIKLMQITPSQEAKIKEKNGSQAKLLPVIITLNLSSDYHSLGRFINDMENAEVFLAVQEMKITRLGQDSLSQNVNLLLRTYVSKE
ncbi:MAG: type 4a pilus biogenesis protein PilO [Candidatus Omnitrophica bacterium]|nr:type 4a pilus biogenesis protein PilO [Candidatus Omnitrophota bacterium]